MFNHFREYTLHPVTGETATEPMLITDPFTSFVCLDTFKTPNGDTVEFAYIDCYNVYYIPTDPSQRTAQTMPTVYVGDQEYTFGGYLTVESNGNLAYPFANTEMGVNKYYVSRVCTMKPIDLVTELNKGNYILSNMPGAIWLRADAYQEDENHVPTVIARIEGGYTYYSTIALSAYIKYLTHYYGTASYTPIGDAIPKYSMDNTNGRVGIIQTKTATAWANRQSDDCLNFADIDNTNSNTTNKLAKYNADGNLTSNQPNSSNANAVLIYGQLSSTAVVGKIAQFYEDNNHRISIDTNVSSADKVNTSVTITPDNGATQGTQGIEFDGSVAKSLQVTKNFVGLGNVENYDVEHLPLVTEENIELFQTFQQKIIDSTKGNTVVVVDASGQITNSTVTTAQLDKLLKVNPSLNQYLLASQDLGVANGVCPLDADAKIPVSHLPLQTTKLMGFFKVDTTTHKAYIEESETTISYEEVTPIGSENPSEEGWYEDGTGGYILTSDTVVEPGKTYYIQTSTPTTTPIYLEDGEIPSGAYFESGYCYIADNSVADHTIVIGLDETDPTKEFLVSSGDRLYALVDTTVTPNTVDWSLYRDSDVVSSVCGKVGAVVLQPSDIVYNENGTSYALDNNWAKHSFSEVDTKINTKLNHSMAVAGGATNGNLVMVTDANGEIVPGSVTTTELGLLSGHVNALLDTSDTSVTGGSGSAGKVAKLNTSGFLNQSMLSPAMNMGMLVFEQAEYSITSGVFTMNISNSDIILQTDGEPLPLTSHLFVLPLDNTWTTIAMTVNDGNGITIDVDSSTHGISISANVDAEDTTQTETMPIAILYRRS